MKFLRKTFFILKTTKPIYGFLQNESNYFENGCRSQKMGFLISPIP